MLRSRQVINIFERCFGPTLWSFNQLPEEIWLMLNYQQKKNYFWGVSTWHCQGERQDECKWQSFVSRGLSRLEIIVGKTQIRQILLVWDKSWPNSESASHGNTDAFITDFRAFLNFFSNLPDLLQPVMVEKKTLPEAQRTDPGCWVHNLSKYLNLNSFKLISVKLLQLVAIWPPDGATCIGCQFCHRMHHLHIDSKFDHQWHQLH